MARSILSLGMFSFLAARIAVRRRGLEFGSPPPMREAMVSSRIRRVKTRPRLASVAAFLCLIVAHLECPDMTIPLLLHEISRDRAHCVAASQPSALHDGRAMPQLSAEDYGEPQTRVAGEAKRSEDRNEFSTGREDEKRRGGRVRLIR